MIVEMNRNRKHDRNTKNTTKIVASELIGIVYCKIYEGRIARSGSISAA